LKTLKKIITSRFFILSLCVAFLVSIIPVVLTAMGQGAYVKTGFQTIASPFQWCFSKIGEGFSGFPEYFRTVDELRKENEELKAKIEEMENDVYDARMLKDENDFLRSYLATRAEHIDLELTDATVIGYNVTNYETVCTLSKGSLAGIEKNMPVITEKGLVGYVSETGATWSRITIITETNAAVGVYIERSGVTGIVEGSLSDRLDGHCRMVYVEAGSDIKVGDEVDTSGSGSFYPRGISVGRVVSITEDPTTRTLIAIVEPTADISSVHKVMIVTSFDRIEETNAESAD